jgi:phosphoribosylglycinamide formyltransferase 2
MSYGSPLSPRARKMLLLGSGELGKEVVIEAQRLGVETIAVDRYADSIEEMREAVMELGLPCVIKPIMSSSGKGQSVCRSEAEIESCWSYAMEGGRAKKKRVIVEGFVRFQSEITLLTVRSVSGTVFCEPIGHVQKDGDYIESWQPHAMSAAHREQSEHIARQVTEALGGWGLYGVELFLTEEGVLFSEVSPRPHDTGMVTMATQDLSEFALHARAILGLPIPSVRLLSPGASHTLKAARDHVDFTVEGLDEALAIPSTQVRVFGKPDTKKGRRMAVALSTAADAEEARALARTAAESLSIRYYD